MIGLGYANLQDFDILSAEMSSRWNTQPAKKMELVVDGDS